MQKLLLCSKLTGKMVKTFKEGEEGRGEHDMFILFICSFFKFCINLYYKQNLKYDIPKSLYLTNELQALNSHPVFF